ncbi:hypothetical protein GCM10010320_42940 [Streptomyces caelestis]|uniref:Uncharacterized protein n=1 Tax=Streptomyces caelestis TaxID=36816 RepID=A0A7W9H0S3_9ACTN|nr:hypothetical protein [Streptomyces caelestis]GGW57411.1 hypothetical protein GCM10010320_42940 [Streptomyces caelestis]
MTQVPTGKVNAHQVIENRIPCRRARSTWAVARQNHSSAKPHHGHAVEHGEDTETLAVRRRHDPRGDVRERAGGGRGVPERPEHQ